MRRAPDVRGSQPRTPSACHMRPVTAITARCTVHCSCTIHRQSDDNRYNWLYATTLPSRSPLPNARVPYSTREQCSAATTSLCQDSWRLAARVSARQPRATWRSRRTSLAGARASSPGFGTRIGPLTRLLTSWWASGCVSRGRGVTSAGCGAPLPLARRETARVPRRRARRPFEAGDGAVKPGEFGL